MLAEGKTGRCTVAVCARSVCQGENAAQRVRGATRVLNTYRTSTDSVWRNGGEDLNLLVCYLAAAEMIGVTRWSRVRSSSGIQIEKQEEIHINVGVEPRFS